jgi:hypothetical protein
VKRVGVGWGLAKKSWAVVRADRSLLVFPDELTGGFEQAELETAFRAR